MPVGRKADFFDIPILSEIKPGGEQAEGIEHLKQALAEF